MKDALPSWADRRVPSETEERRGPTLLAFGQFAQTGFRTEQRTRPSVGRVKREGHFSHPLRRVSSCLQLRPGPRYTHGPWGPGPVGSSAHSTLGTDPTSGPSDLRVEPEDAPLGAPTHPDLQKGFPTVFRRGPGPWIVASLESPARTVLDPRFSGPDQTVVPGPSQVPDDSPNPVVPVRPPEREVGPGQGGVVGPSVLLFARVGVPTPTTSPRRGRRPVTRPLRRRRHRHPFVGVSARNELGEGVPGPESLGRPSRPLVGPGGGGGPPSVQRPDDTDSTSLWSRPRRQIHMCAHVPACAHTPCAHVHVCVVRTRRQGPRDAATHVSSDPVPSGGCRQDVSVFDSVPVCSLDRLQRYPLRNG